jgi:hypothetical protein
MESRALIHMSLELGRGVSYVDLSLADHGERGVAQIDVTYGHLVPGSEEYLCGCSTSSTAQ